MKMNLDFLRFTVTPRELPEYNDQAYFTWFESVFPEFFDAQIMTDSELWTNYQYYDFCLACTNRILIFYDSALKGASKGVNVSIPSGGLWILDKLFGCSNFIDFLILLIDRSEQFNFRLNFTRCDFCFDDFNYREEGHYFSAKEFYLPWTEKRFVSHSLHSNCFQDLPECKRMEGGHALGWTFYLGKRTSGRYLRIYDKYIESAKKHRRWELSKHHTDSTEPEVIDAVRYEFEIHKEYANNLVFALIRAYKKGYSYQFRDFINGWFKISATPLDRANNNQSRDFVPDEKWKNFCDLEFSEEFIEPLFVRDRKATSYHDNQNWIYKAVLPSLCMRLVVDGSLGSLESYCRKFLEDNDLPNKYKRMLFEYRGKPADDLIYKYLHAYGFLPDGFRHCLEDLPFDD